MVVDIPINCCVRLLHLVPILPYKCWEVGSNLPVFEYCCCISHCSLCCIQNTFEAVDSVLCSCDDVNEKCVENYWKYDCRRQVVFTLMWKWLDVNSQATFSVRVLKNPPSLEGGNFDSIFSLKIMEVLRYKESLCQWMYKEKGMSLPFLISLLVMYNNGCCVHLRLLSAVENNFAGEPLGVSSLLCILELSTLTRVEKAVKTQL